MAEQPTKIGIPRITINDLPTDVLLLILNRLDQKDLRSLTLVSPTLLALSNNLITSLSFLPPPEPNALKNLLTRFPSVTDIAIESTRISRALVEISNSQLKLETLRIRGCPRYPDEPTMSSLKHSASGRFKKIQSLELGEFAKGRLDLQQRKDQAVEFIQLFPSVLELHLRSSDYWDDDGIEKLAPNVPNLRVINVGNCKRLTDLGLNMLSVNCVNLERVCFVECDELTAGGFCAFLQNRLKKIRVLDLPGFNQSDTRDLLQLARMISSCQNLERLVIGGAMASKDGILSAIAKSNPPLASLRIWRIPERGGYTMTGLATLLSACQGVRTLEIFLPPLSLDSQDKKMSEIIKFLPCLRHVFISTKCGTHLFETLFCLIGNCRLLESIHLRSAQRGIKGFDASCRKNNTVKAIFIYPEADELLRRAIELVCPCLELLRSY